MIDIACMEGNGNPSTEDVVKAFPGLNIRLTHVDRERFARRGLVRNQQIKNAPDPEWMFFADCDNVYHPEFFRKLHKALRHCGDVKNCIYSVEKIHTRAEETNAYARIAEKHHVISDAYRRAEEIPRMMKLNKRVAAGCMQVVKYEEIMRKNGIYVRENGCRDLHLFSQLQGARSDIQFRRRMGGSTEIKLPTQIHLNHARDKEVGYHLEDQR